MREVYKHNSGKREGNDKKDTSTSQTIRLCATWLGYDGQLPTEMKTIETLVSVHVAENDA